ncbi:putative HTH-type transcriptional regulator YdfH [Thalassobacter stenotrophicus]|uniref:Transcriptional regulator, GntR family n=2 Tax=Thalassobacter stenotrophicus TaxID=266809 RepID=A0ABY1IGW5_9RHOB|nr:putative HTH-type transcriptional regulator YdfH [Thalassobacter stenotrophicus]SHJ15977.1 transcriptional regulator, GntR family [Thalassobacter stenotrophicus DSM 16310]
MVYHLDVTLAKAMSTFNKFWYTKTENSHRARFLSKSNDNLSLPQAEVTLPEQIATELRRDILNGKFAPGATLKERDNALETGVSRTPMREAIRILANEGLVQLRPARSPIVAQPTFKQISDNIVVLTTLELLSADLACQTATDEQIQDIEDAQNKFAAEADLVERVEAFELDMQVHLAITRASNNDVLIDAHRSMLERMWRARFLSARRADSRANVMKQHGQIIDDLKRRDADAVRKSLSAHLELLAVNVRGYFEAEKTDQNAPS